VVIGQAMEATDFRRHSLNSYFFRLAFGVINPFKASGG
jgi:hypothetical protein